MSCVARKPVLDVVFDQIRYKPGWIATKDGYRFEFFIQQADGMFLICSKNKGVDQLCDYRAADLRRFSHMQKHVFS